MLNIFLFLLRTSLGLLLVGLIGFSFYQELNVFPQPLRLSIAVVVAVFFIFTWRFINILLAQQKLIEKWPVVAAALVALFLYHTLEIKNPTFDSAVLSYSNGQKITDSQPDDVSAWGRSATGYNMHPAYDSVIVLNSIDAKFITPHNEVMLLISKPKVALYHPDNTPTESDGISIQVNLTSDSGNSIHVESFLISQEQFLKDKWIIKNFKSDSGISSIRVTLGTGPIGSTPDFDSTVVSVQTPSMVGQLNFLGKITIISTGVFFIFSFLALNVRELMKTRSTGAQTLQIIIYSGLVLGALLILTYWSESRTSYVFYWDFRNYWEKTETLYELLSTGSLGSFIGTFADAYSTDYSALPAVAPAIASLAFGYPSRIVYSLSITALYAAPAYLLVAYLAMRLSDGQLNSGSGRARPAWILSALAIVAGLPVFYGTTLYLMPDIGGVALFVLALLAASTAIRAISNPQTNESPVASLALVRSSISLGVLFSAMFIFRRWYVFAAAGVSLSLAVLVILEFIRGAVPRRVIFTRSLITVTVMSCTTLPFLCWVLFTWSRDFGQHDYSKLYSSYQGSLYSDAWSFLKLFGISAPLICLMGGIFIYRTGHARHLLFLTIASSAIACALFLNVQSPGRHHFYLLMPLMGSCLAGLTILIGRRLGCTAVAGLCFLYVAVTVWQTRYFEDTNNITIIATYSTLTPKTQPYLSGYSAISQWLAIPENSNKKFCLIASSVTINQGLFSELWQVLPGVPKHGFDTRLIQLGQVDSVNGPPSPDIKHCEIFLVGVPFQTHLRVDQQLSLQIVQRDLLTGTGIGTVVQRTPQTFPMSSDIKILAYTAIRRITDLEYEDLVNRFLNAKGPEYSNPAQTK